MGRRDQRHLNMHEMPKQHNRDDKTAIVIALSAYGLPLQITRQQILPFI